MVFYTQLLYCAYLIFIITTSVLLSLHYILKLTYAIVCSTYTWLYTLSGLYMTIPTYGCYVSLVFDVAIYLVYYHIYLVT